MAQAFLLLCHKFVLLVVFICRMQLFCVPTLPTSCRICGIHCQYMTGKMFSFIVQKKIYVWMDLTEYISHV